MPGSIFKGIITSIKENTVRVAPSDAPDRVSMPITVPWHLQKKSGNLAKGMEVVYVLFDDHTGLLLGRLDGEWGLWLPALELDKNLKVGNNATVSGIVTAGGDVVGAGKSLASHTHIAPAGGGGTSPPN